MPRSAPYFWLSLCLPNKSLSPLALPPSAAVLLATRSATSSAKSVRPAPDRPALREGAARIQQLQQAPAAAAARKKLVCWCNRSHPKRCAVMLVRLMHHMHRWGWGPNCGRPVLQHPKRCVQGSVCEAHTLHAAGHDASSSAQHWSNHHVWRHAVCGSLTHHPAHTPCP
jgi:hypothetical protein